MIRSGCDCSGGEEGVALEELFVAPALLLLSVLLLLVGVTGGGGGGWNVGGGWEEDKVLAMMSLS